MRNICIFICLGCSITLLAQTNMSFSSSVTNVGITGTVSGVYINEFHYDNSGSDTGEFVEVAGPAGTDLSTYTITLYNGGDNLKYHTLTLSGTIDDEGAGNGAVSFIISSIQNGAPDGISLSNSSSTSVQFLSYEGTITAADGDSNSVLSVDIGTNENSSTPIGYSLEYNEGTSAWVTITNDSPGDLSQGPLLSTRKNKIKGFKLYPIPASNEFINISSYNKTDMKVTVYDLLGKQVITKMISNDRLDVSMLNTGIYIMKAFQERSSTTKKIIIN